MENEARQHLRVLSTLLRGPGVVGDAQRKRLAGRREIDAVAALVPRRNDEAFGLQQTHGEGDGGGGREPAHGLAGSMVPMVRRPMARALSRSAGFSIAYQDKAATPSEGMSEAASSADTEAWGQSA